jgi:hypothetical protein
LTGTDGIAAGGLVTMPFTLPFYLAVIAASALRRSD